jgi:prolyl 4-hydroxylase
MWTLIWFLHLASLAVSRESPCQDKFRDCGEHIEDCINTPGFMALNCPNTCNTCHLRDFKKRCSPEFLNISSDPVLRSGESDILFQRIANTHLGSKILSREPWLIEIDNFLPAAVINLLLSYVTGWEQSTESESVDANGEGTYVTTSRRTSSTFWCRAGCEDCEAAVYVRGKIAEVRGVEERYFEPMQLLKYEQGQSFVAHHDFSYQELTLACGPRVLTFVLYLSDVEEGGETVFPEFQVSITPKLGKAVLWSNTLSSNPAANDTRMVHEARPVTKGVKYAANVWVRLLEWERSALWACVG